MGEDTYNKVDLVIEQLEIALSLFLEARSYVSALTLAGAAEEILGKAAKIRGVYCRPELSWINPPKT